jgi:hypothetical protein
MYESASDVNINGVIPLLYHNVSLLKYRDNVSVS